MTDRPRGLIKGSGRRGASRDLAEVVSVRFDSRTLARLRELASEGGQSVSEWIRATASTEALRRDLPPEVPGYRVTGWQCQHVHLTAGALAARAVCGQGCEMQPIYEPAPVAA